MFDIKVYVCEHVYTGLIGTIRVTLVYEADDFFLLIFFFKFEIHNENVIHISILFLNLVFMYFILNLKFKF